MIGEQDTSDGNYVWKKLGSINAPATSEPGDSDRRAGYEAGYAEGRAAAEAEVAKRLQQLADAAEAFVSERSRLESDAVERVITLSRDVFEQMFKVELTQSVELLSRLKSLLMAELPSSENVILLLSETHSLTADLELPFTIETSPDLSEGEVRVQSGGVLVGLDVISAVEDVFGKR